MRQPNHPAIVARLKRAEGHLHSVIQMFEGDHACRDLVQQLQAVEKAVASAKAQLIHDHVDHCLASDASEGVKDTHAVLDEVKGLMKYL